MRKQAKKTTTQTPLFVQKGSVARAGFTLVELLVVISIIALLLSILMPSLAKVRESAKQIVCQSNVKQLGVCFGMYASDNKESFGEGWIFNNNQPVPPVGMYQGVSWPNELGPYYQKSKKLLLCPSAQKGDAAVIKKAKRYGTLAIGEGNGRTKQAWVWPWKWTPQTHPDQFLRGPMTMNAGDIASYSRNGWTCDPPAALVSVNGNAPTINNWRKQTVSGGNKIPLLLDGVWNEIYPNETEPPEFEDFSQWGMDMFCINRHGGGTINSVFVDLSTRKVGLKELWTLKWHRNFNTANIYTTAGGMPASEWPVWMRGFKNY